MPPSREGNNTDKDINIILIIYMHGRVYAIHKQAADDVGKTCLLPIGWWIKSSRKGIFIIGILHRTYSGEGGTGSRLLFQMYSAVW